MVTKISKIGLVVGILCALLLLGFIIAARTSADLGSGASFHPPTREPLPGTAGMDYGTGMAPGSPMQGISAHGPDAASAAYQTALSTLPFSAHLPTYLPQNVILNNVGTQFDEDHPNQGLLDLYYVGTGKPPIDFHVYQTNQPIDKNPPALIQQHWSDPKTMQLGGSTWDYRLLTYPQPSGIPLRLHSLSRTFDDGVYVEIDIRVGDTANETVQELSKVAQSFK